MPAVVVVMMGPCGCGKTTVGRLVADGLDAEFLEGDSFHPGENRTKMMAGEPLTDTDRWPWLNSIAEHAASAAASGKPVVVACSALKRTYRDRLASSGADTVFVMLDGPKDLIHARLVARPDHFMPPSLLESQLETLERPSLDENAIVVDIGQPPETLARAIVQAVTEFSNSRTKQGRSRPGIETDGIEPAGTAPMCS